MNHATAPRPRRSLARACVCRGRSFCLHSFAEPFGLIPILGRRRRPRENPRRTVIRHFEDEETTMRINDKYLLDAELVDAIREVLHVYLENDRDDWDPGGNFDLVTTWLDRGDMEKPRGLEAA